MRRALTICLALLMAPAAASAQDSQTLADIKQDMSVLYTQLQRLRQELNTTGLSDMQISGSALDRINTIEAELQRVTGKAEELEFRIEQVVNDGTNRLGDLDFRLCELEPNCDIGSLGDTPRLGGDAVPEQGSTGGGSGMSSGSASGTGGPLAGGAQLAVSEEEDYRAAQQALENNEFRRAAELFATFRADYPQGPLEPEALVGEGLALEGTGDLRGAARRYLDVYSGYPEAEVAPESLWRLGTSLAELGSVAEACVTLAEVGERYPQSSYVNEARSSMGDLNCQQ